MESREKDDDCQYCAKCLMAARHPKGDWRAQFRKEVKQHTLILFQMDPAKIDLITHGGRLCKRVKYCFSSTGAGGARSYRSKDSVSEGLCCA